MVFPRRLSVLKRRFAFVHVAVLIAEYTAPLVSSTR
jgi:hypothetical protein